VTGSYCLLSLKKSHVTSHYLYYSVCSKCSPPARAQAHRCWQHSQTLNSVLNNCATPHCWYIVSVHRCRRPWYERLAVD